MNKTDLKELLNNNICDICGCETPLNTDRNHNKIRGFLCNHCLYMLSNARHNPEILRKAILYLEKQNDNSR